MTRRHLIGALGAAGVAGASGVTFAGAAGASPDSNEDGGAMPGPSAAPVAVDTRDLPNPIVVGLGAIDFHPISDATYAYVSPGGVQMPAGSAFFQCDLRVPVGATLVDARIFANPTGGPVLTPRLARYNPLAATFEDIATGTSTTGTVPEAIVMPVNHVVEAGWNYRFATVLLEAGGAILYGGEVSYTIPPDPAPPTGVFVPFAGVNPRVYDSRTGAGKLAAGEERVIPLGVPGTVRAAAFNITVTETETAGFVACFKADIAWPGNSSVNWYEGGANTANLVVCAVDATGAIRIRGGNDDTHVVIDLIGTFA